MLSLSYVTLQMFSQAHVNYCALHMPVISLLCVPLDRHVALDFLGFASCMLYSDISAFRWVPDRYAPLLRFRNRGNER